jgi:hypothetical protein
MESFSDILIGFFRQKDFIFYFSLALSAVVVIAAEGLWRLRKAKSRPLPNLPQDDSRLDFLWTVIPVFVLLCLASVQIDRIGDRAKAVGKVAARALRSVVEHRRQPSS